MRPLNLRLLPPPMRLIFVALATSGVLFINNFYAIFLATLFSIVIFLSSGRPSWRSVYLIVAPTALLYFVGNVVFSPPDKGGFNFLIFCLNSTGLEFAIARSLRIGAILLVSLAWLASTPINELYASVAPLRKLRPWALSICRSLQLTRREYLAIAQSFRIRGMRLKSFTAIIKACDWHQIRSNGRIFLALLRVIISRQFTHIAKAALAWERHHPVPVNNSKTDTAIEAHKLFIRYHKDVEPSLQNASLVVESGKFVYVTGRARAGKSTLLRALGGIIPRVLGELAGEVYVSGIDTRSLKLGQYASLATYTDADVESNILGLTVGQEIMLMAKDEIQARHCLEVMSISHLWERETTKLSGGQQVRLLLAGTLAGEAKVIILDDPLDQLDPSGCEDFVAALSKILKEQEKTILIADRHYDYFLSLVDTVLPIDSGIVPKLEAKTVLSIEDNLNHYGIEPINSKLPAHDQHHNNRTVARMENVHVSFGDVSVLKDVTLDIAEGEVVVIQGPNGSGKTTAMLTLAGAINPDGGKVEVAGRVGYLFQDASSQIIAPTVFEELAVAPRMQGRSELDINQIVSKLLDFTGLSGKSSPLDLHPQDMKILAMAAMSVGVRLIILDEPSVGLDSFGIMKVLNFIETLRCDGVATVIISHDEIFARMSDRVLRFENGRCAAVEHL